MDMIFKTEMLKIWRTNSVVLVLRVSPKAGEDPRLGSKSIRQKNFKRFCHSLAIEGLEEVHSYCGGTIRFIQSSS